MLGEGPNTSGYFSPSGNVGDRLAIVRVAFVVFVEGSEDRIVCVFCVTAYSAGFGHKVYQ